MVFEFIMFDWSTFWIGAASSTVVIIFFYLARFAIGNLLSRISLSRNITGTWKTTFFKGSDTFTETAKISQLFTRVWGTIEFVMDGECRIYKMTGSIKHDILVANYEIINSKKTLDRGSFTLRLSSDGNKLDGCYSWTDDKSTKPQGDNYAWNRLHK